MPDPRDFRSLAHRVELGFHQRPNRFRRRTWLAGAVLALVAVVWVALALGRGQNAQFSAGPVSTAHRMFENDCAACHSTWGPAERLALDPHATSISNDKCLKCHPAPAHQPRLNTAHSAVAEISCGECHREHRHQQTLANVADAFCTSCHADLKAPLHGGSERFANTIDSFESSPESGSHPEFAVHRLLNQIQAPTPMPRDRIDVIAWFLREDDQGTKLGIERWQDRARIQFNHKLHLRLLDDLAGLPAGQQTGYGRWPDLSLDRCETCHQPDSAGRYMLPISYQRHCAECHPLRFDDRTFPGETVPHREPAIVRGFLIDKYSRQERPLARDLAAQSEKLDDLFDLPYAPRLPMDVAEKIEHDVAEIERGMPIPLTVASAEHALFGPEARGGCRYCHEVVEPSSGGLWEITKPRIPDRWLEHSRFRHHSHTLLKCRDCHAGVDASFSTGDVLLPEIAVCRSCHARNPQWTPAAGAGRSRLEGARTQCVECHVYHHAGLAK